MADITISEQKLQELITKAAAEAVQAVQRAERTKPMKQSEVRAPSDKKWKTKGRPHPAGLRAFDPTSKAQGSLSAKEWLWNPAKIHRCPCGEVAYADTQEFIGTFSIADAKKGTVIKESDGITIVAERPGWQSMEDLPEGLEYTKEKAKHMNECRAKHAEVDPETLRAMYADKLTA